MANTYTDSIVDINGKPATGVSTITPRPNVAGSVVNEPYVGLYAILTEEGIEITYENGHTLNTEN